MPTPRKAKPKVVQTSVDDTVYLRNCRPVGRILKYGDMRHKLEYRGHRGDTIALPVDALTETDIARWLSDGSLEQISKESFLRLAKRKLDQQRPDQTLPSSVKIKINPEDHRRPTLADEKVLKGYASPSIQVAGEILSTEEELDLLELQSGDQVDYPSKYR